MTFNRKTLIVGLSVSGGFRGKLGGGGREWGGGLWIGVDCRFCVVRFKRSMNMLRVLLLI